MFLIYLIFFKTTLLFNAKTFGKKDIKILSKQSITLRKKLVKGIKKLSETTPPELRKIENSFKTFFSILYSGKNLINFFSLLKRWYAIALSENQGFFGLNNGFLRLKTLLSIDQPS